MVDLAWLWIAGFIAVFAGAATLAVLELDDARIYRAVLLPLYPGLVTADHIDADGHILRTLLVSSLVNAIAYAGLVIALRLLWKALRSPHLLHPPRETYDHR